METEFGSGVSVTGDFPETGDLSTQSGGDAIEAARKVQFSIKNVEPRITKSEQTDEMLFAKLNVRVAIGPQGVDGNGKYAGKNLFAELLTWFNEEKYTSDWWKKQARFPYKSFLKAMGFDPAQPPKVTDDFVIGLVGREFVADIIKSEIQVATGNLKANGKKEYVGTGEFKNELANFKAVA